MIEYTGDIHGSFGRISSRVLTLRHKGLEVADTIVVLGDVGANFYLDWRDREFKERLNEIGIDIFCIQGNHECRPHHVSSYHEDIFKEAKVLVEDEYPHLKFAIDGEIYNLDGRRSIVIGGAYSIDKQYRLTNNWPWWDDEQPSDEIKRKVENVLAENEWKIDQVLSHTCPYSFIPWSHIIAPQDPSLIDYSTELWLDEIEKKLIYDRWLCGHYHIDLKEGRLRFVFNDMVR